jgi:hypothetical protein
MFALTMRRGALSLALWFGVAVVSVAIAALVVEITRTMQNVEPVRAKAPPISAVVWGDRVFLGSPSIAHWLKTRGVGYSVWARRHPPADRLLKRRYAALVAAKHKKSR